MRKITIAVLMGAAAAMAACDNFSEPQTEDEAVESMPAEDMPLPEPMPEPVPPTTTPPPTGENTALPPDQRSSEESVRPESETLFY